MADNQQARMVDLPTSVRGLCFHDDNGEEFIVLNSRLSWEQNQRTWLHEKDHIKNGDLYDLSYNEYGGAEP